MIPPRSTVTPFFVQFLANGSDMAFSTILRVYTNASIFTVPIHCFDGKLKVSTYVAFRNHVCTCTFRPQNGLASQYKSRTLHSSKLKVLVILLNGEVCHIVSNNLHSLDFQFRNSVVWQWLVICISVIRPDTVTFCTGVMSSEPLIFTWSFCFSMLWMAWRKM